MLSFVAAVTLSAWTQDVFFGLIFGGLSAISFLFYWLSRPLQGLEQNWKLVARLGIVGIPYWTRLSHAIDQGTVDQDLQAAADDAIAEINRLIEEHDNRGGRHPESGKEDGK